MRRLRFGAQLGQGGGGEVYRARLRGGREVAVKRLGLAQELSPGHRERLRCEAELIAGLEHANIVKLYGEETIAGQVCLVMELVDGVNLGRVMGAGPVPVAASVTIVRALLSALHCAHQAGVVHRDVKPGNVLVSWQGEVKLVDFGLATREGGGPSNGALIRGTLPYLSPEQAAGKVVDRRSDLYAVGTVFYELLTGRPVWQGHPTDAMASLLVRRAPTSAVDVCPTVPAELNSLVMKLLEPAPAARFQSAKAALDVLPEYADGPAELAELMRGHRDSGTLRPPSLEAGKSGRSWRWATAAALLAAVGLGTVGVYEFTRDRAGSPMAGEDAETAAEERARDGESHEAPDTRPDDLVVAESLVSVAPDGPEDSNTRKTTESEQEPTRDASKRPAKRPSRRAHDQRAPDTPAPEAADDEKPTGDNTATNRDIYFAPRGEVHYLGGKE